MSTPSRVSRRTLLAAALAAPVGVAAAACGTSSSGTNADPARASSSAAQALAATVSYQPALSSTSSSPTAPATVSVTAGTLREVVLTNATGTAVTGAIAPDQRSWSSSEPLGYGASYTWAGAAVGADGATTTALGGSFTVVDPAAKVSGTVNIGDGQTVGIAAPVIVQFDGPITDKAAVQKAMTVTATPATVGAWAWLPDSQGGSRAHWRPQDYWAPNTTVALDAKIYGVDMGGGAFGSDDLTSNFTVGRSQVVKASVPSHRMVVERDGQSVMDVACSYGEGNEARNTTRNGIHVVTEKYEDFVMSNPPYYTNARERWATRISNNGEFIHANPNTTGDQGSSNVTNGCINLSTEDAQAYFGTAMYGDPVEVTGSPIDLSSDDGDIYDWSIDWPTWQSMSAV